MVEESGGSFLRFLVGGGIVVEKGICFTFFVPARNINSAVATRYACFCCVYDGVAEVLVGSILVLFC